MADFSDNILLSAGSTVNVIGNMPNILTVSNGSTVSLFGVKPEDIFVKNGSQINFSASPWIPDKGGISNNNTNNVDVTGYVAFYDDIHIGHGANVEVGKFENIAISHGSNSSVIGFDPRKTDLKVRNGSQVNIIGKVYFVGGDIAVDGTNNVDVTDGHEVHVVNGINIIFEGIGGIPSSNISVRNGTRVDTGKGYVIIRGKDERVFNGSSVDVFGIQPGDILITHHADSNIFRGIQKEDSDILVTNGSTVLLTGVAIGGTISDVGVPCEIFIASMKNDYEFVKGQITEIPEIFLDSSIKLGVKLYSCDNTLLNVSTFTSAYFTFDDELQLPANIDPVSNLIYVLANPSDLDVLTRNKVYDMRVHVTDKSGNTSIVLIRKLRFV